MTVASAKKKRRRMKQMEGLLVLSRPRADDAAFSTADHQHHQLKNREVKAKKVHVMLQPQQLELAYSAQEDQEMKAVLGRIDLQGAQLEQTPDGFVIHSDKHDKKFRLHDKDKATVDAWFYAVYATITEFSRATIETSWSDLSAWHFSAVLSSSLRDEATDLLEFELSCQLVIPSRQLDQPSIRWKIWRTAADVQAFDEELRRSPSVVALLRDVTFPRERKRDSLFGGLRRKSLQELKEQQLSVYIGRIFSIPQLSANPDASSVIRRFLRFDVFFELSCEQPNENNDDSVDATENAHKDDFSSEQINSADVESVPGNEVNHQSLQELEPIIEDMTEVSPPPSTSEVVESRSRPGSVTFDGEQFDEITDVEPEADPVAARKLHKQIIRRVREVFNDDEDRVRDFQDQTKDFGRDKTEAKEYCAFLHGALGAKQCCVLIPMMARLMPDEHKRHALMDARTAIIRKAIRRNRRRSKQFSESVVMQQQQLQQRMLAQELSGEWASQTSSVRTRPKSDSLSVLMSSNSQAASQYGLHRSSMVETRSFRATSDTSSVSSVNFEDTGRRSLPDARRKLESRPSLNLFGETIQGETIEEENPATRDSEDETDKRPVDGEDDDIRVKKRPESYSSEMRSLPPVFRRINSNSWLQAPNSAPGGQPGYGQRLSTITRAPDPVQNLDNNESHEQEHQAPTDQSVDNPVLARLKKQGAVNFMLR